MFWAAISAICLASPAPSPQLSVDYQGFNGLTMSYEEIPVVTGSGFQYYEEGWKQGYFSSAWSPVTRNTLPDGRIEVTYNGYDGQAVGTHTYTPRPNGFDAEYRFVWRGDKSARLEVSLARLWAPLVAQGKLKVGGIDMGPLNSPVKSGATFEERIFGESTRSIVFESPFVDINIESNLPIRAMDARNYSVAWAIDKDLFWIGQTDVLLEPQKPLIYRVSWTMTPKGGDIQPAQSLEGQSKPLLDAQHPVSEPIPLIPQPKRMQKGDGRVSLASTFKFLGQRDLPLVGKFFEDLLWERWDKATLPPTEDVTAINLALSNLGLKPEGYRISVDHQGIKVTGQDRDGLRHGLRTLAALVEPRNGRLVLPHVEITDYPSLDWRGVHMFVGPEALEFQSRLMDRVLGPAKLNRVVLQCERTNWEAIKGTETPNTMDRKDLKALFTRYRSQGFEPIPLVQSLGHASWVFANRQNLDIAINPDVPFTVDPRKSKTRDLYRKLWTEVNELLEPRTVHFGLDEFDMRGIPDDPAFSTRLWQRQVPFLLDLADELGVEPMMWGDMMLHPSEAPDAANADTLEEAKARRAALEKGTWIADWHYKDDANPAIFKSLDLWKRAGMKPIASTWFRPKNVYGFTHAALKSNSGVLQTTWAGYESNEGNMVREFDQFEAYLLAAEYSWSGRKELPKDLPYDVTDVLRRMFFAGPQAVRSQPGRAVAIEGHLPGKRHRVGAFTIESFEPVQLTGITKQSAKSAPSSLSIEIQEEARVIVVGLDCLAKMDDITHLGKINVQLTDGTIVSKSLEYGAHIRAVDDPAGSMVSPRHQGISAVVVSLGEDAVKVDSVTIEAENRAAGLRVHGLTLL